MKPDSAKFISRVMASSASCRGRGRPARQGDCRHRLQQQQRGWRGGAGARANPGGLFASKWRVRVTATAGPAKDEPVVFRSIGLFAPGTDPPNECFTLGAPKVCV